MVWDQIEATPAHVTYLVLPTFLISYTLFSNFIRNRLHLSEPPLALLVGIILGPRGLGWLTPNLRTVKGPVGSNEPSVGGWEWGDDVVQEVTRVIVGIQVFAVAVELPKFYASRHWKSVGMMLGPVMTFGWLVRMSEFHCRRKILTFAITDLCIIRVPHLSDRLRNLARGGGLPYANRSSPCFKHSVQQPIQRPGTEAHQRHAVCGVRL